MAKIYDPEFLGLQISRLMGNEAIVFCPYHSDSNPSAEFNFEKGLFYCFGCQERKTVSQLVDDLGGELVELGEVPTVDLAGHAWDRGRKIWFDILKNPSAFYNDYLTERGVNAKLTLDHDIRENEDGVIFPIRDKAGVLVGAQTRQYTKKPKYLFHGSRTPVWPIDKLDRPGPLFIVEGVFGVLRAESAGAYPTIAMMGAGSVQHVGKFLRGVGSTIKPMAIMDNDYAGLLAAGKFVLMGIPVILTPFKSDPDEWNIGKWKDVSNNYFRYLTWEVEDVISRSEKPGKLRSALYKFWRNYDG